MAEAVSVTIQPDGIATIVLDLPDKPVNTMTRQVWGDLDGVIRKLESGGAKGLIIASNKPKTFVAGADLNEIIAMADPELREYLENGQRIYQRLSDLSIPTVAAINGDALGGGLELALACKMRVAVDDSGLQLGLPETKVGLIPGWGGTVRFPRLVGLVNALPLMLSGKSISGAEAQKIGLVNQLVSRENLLEAARELVLRPVAEATPPSLLKKEIETLLDAARDTQIRKFKDHYPAPLRLIEVVRDSYEKGVDAGFAGEIKGLIDLRNSETGRNLLRVFFMRSTAKKDAAKKAGGTPREVKSAVVFGGGTMGSGIAHALVKSGIATTIVEANEDLACTARGRVQKIIDDDVRAGRMASEAGGRASGLLSVALKPECSANSDLVIEAIVEQLPAKVALFRQLDQIVRPDAILATNTSSLSVSEIATATSNPSRVVGIHFFNPVPRMPLVEVVRTKKSDAIAVATAVALAAKLGKSPVLCNDAPGFIVNRVLFPQLQEACRLCQEGFDITSIDRAIKQWGMPMGPFELMDEIGLDVTLFILQSFQESLGERFAPAVALQELVGLGCKGRKTGKGFYVYSKEKGVLPTVNQEAMMIFKNTHRPISSPEQIQQRVLNPMAVEAKQLLAEGVVEDAEAIDVATIMGLGFANFRGGLATWAGLVGCK